MSENVSSPDLRSEIHCGMWMPLVRKHLSRDLVDDPAFERISSMADRLPGAVQGAIEVRLGAEPAPVDFSVRIAGPKAAGVLAPDLKPDHVRRFLSDWSRSPDPRIPFIWAEFDLDRPASELEPIFIVRTDGEGAPPIDWVLQDLLRETLGADPPAAQKQTVRRALERLPEPGELVYLFDLRCRGTETLRLDFFGLEPAAMQRFMVALDRPDLARALEQAATTAAGAKRFHFNFDIDTEGIIQPRMGIEASYSTFPRRGSEWQSLLDDLVSAGLCTPEKRDASLDWPGYTAYGAEPELWPLGNDGPKGFFIRTLSHVKFVCHPDKEPEAKVYLLFGRQIKNQDGKLTIAAE